MPKFIQCDRLPRAPRKRSVPSVNDHPAIVDIFRKFFENGPCIQTISFLVTMISRLLTDFGMLVFFTNLSLMEFEVRHLALFLLFSVIGGFGLFWMVNPHKNIQLMLEFLKSLFLVLDFSYYTLMTFLMMLSVILLSMLMILLPTQNVVRHLICGNN